MSGGELTVTVRGNGRGGPNQEYALALAGPARTCRAFARWRAIPTAPMAAPARHRSGGRLDRPDHLREGSAPPRPGAYLANNDATSFFEATGDLLLTGPTLTNVNDLRVILVDPVQCSP